MSEGTSFVQELKNHCYGFRRERAEAGEVVCKVRLGSEGLLNQEKELNFILRAGEALGGFLE